MVTVDTPRSALSTAKSTTAAPDRAEEHGWGAHEARNPRCGRGGPRCASVRHPSKSRPSEVARFPDRSAEVLQQHAETGRPRPL